MEAAELIGWFIFNIILSGDKFFHRKQEKLKKPKQQQQKIKQFTFFSCWPFLIKQAHTHTHTHIYIYIYIYTRIIK